ncbi:MAG: sodium:solute symporter family protein [Hyphomicrobiaceae bacterium]|nr:sodium:solute symporter family protein [Hyphomicrobiaceae bacterium]
MNSVLAAIFVYVAIQFAIGVWASRRMASAADYILAGRTLGPVLVGFSVFASFFGAEALVSSAGAVYEQGLAGAVTDPFGYGFALVLVGVVFSAALWRRNLTTFADLFRQRYSPGVEKLVVLMLLPGSLFWAAAQIRAFGQVLSANSTLDIVTAVTLAAVIVASYSVVGGLLADSITDVIQGAVLIVGLLLLAIAVAAMPPGSEALTEPGRVAASAKGGGAGSAADAATALAPGLWVWLEKLAVPICGTIVSVELISRFLGARSAHVARIGTVGGGLLYLTVGLIPVYLGLSAQSLLPGLEEPEQVVSKLASELMPGVLRIVFIGAIVSAILSVVHAALHGAAAQLSHNILTRIYPETSSRGKLWAARLMVMVLSFVAFGLSLTSDRIKELVETASAFGSAGVFVVAVFALFTRFGGPLAAYAGMLTGMGVWLAARYGFDAETPYLMALACSLFAYVAVALIAAERNVAPAPDIGAV